MYIYILYIYMYIYIYIYIYMYIYIYNILMLPGVTIVRKLIFEKHIQQKGYSHTPL